MPIDAWSLSESDKRLPFEERPEPTCHTGVNFDELILGGGEDCLCWAHMERLDTLQWYVSFGETQLYIQLNEDGSVRDIAVGEIGNLDVSSVLEDEPQDAPAGRGDEAGLTG
jgi:hypothetical protein